jgi:platelet-activating factor acetylhydrolase
MGLIHDAVLKLDGGHYPENLDPNSTNGRKKDVNEVLKMFVGSLDVHRPGSIIWGGHSFGATTTVQLLKSTYWQTQEPDQISSSPIFNPSPSSSLVAQITPSSPTILLDMWCLPFHSRETRFLWEKPMPCYAPSGPGGTALLSVLSEAFYKWKGNAKDVIRIISPPAGADKAAPYCFYPRAAAHLSQSDFGVLFPWPTRKAFKTEDPKRYITLNVRAVLQVLRENGFEVADTSREDMEASKEADEKAVADAGKGQDWRILDGSGAVDGWIGVQVPERVEGSRSTENDARTPMDTPAEVDMLASQRL